MVEIVRHIGYNNSNRWHHHNSKYSFHPTNEATNLKEGKLRFQISCTFTEKLTLCLILFVVKGLGKNMLQMHINTDFTYFCWTNNLVGSWRMKNAAVSVVIRSWVDRIPYTLRRKPKMIQNIKFDHFWEGQKWPEINHWHLTIAETKCVCVCIWNYITTITIPITIYISMIIK